MGRFQSVALQFSGLSAAGLAATRADLVIVESAIASGGSVLSHAQLDSLAAGGQTVIAYVNTSVTDASRSYWNSAWVTAPDPAEPDVGTVTALAPDWLKNNLGGVDFYPEHAGADALIVDYRDSAWHDLVVQTALAQVNAGYGGVFLDDVGRYYEAGYAGGSYDPTLADAMMQLVIDVSNAVHVVDVDAVVVVNSGVYIGGDSSGGASGGLFGDYLDAIDGVLIENAFDTGANSDLETARSTYTGKDVIALESLARAPDVEALLDYAISTGILVQLAPDEGYDDPVTVPLLGSGGRDTMRGLKGHANVMAGGDGNDIMTGARLGDSLYGHGGNDKLVGGGGADSLFGGQGTDLLVGGAANDVFVFGTNSGSDRVADFRQGSDRVDLSALDTTFADVQAALHLVRGTVRLDLSDIGGAGWIDFSGQHKLAAFDAGDFIL